MRDVGLFHHLCAAYQAPFCGKHLEEIRGALRRRHAEGLDVGLRADRDGVSYHQLLSVTVRYHQLLTAQPACRPP